MPPKLNSAKNVTCPSNLKSFLIEVNFSSNTITTDNIQNGHLLAIYYNMKKNKIGALKKFYELLKNSTNANHTNGDNLCSFDKVYSKCCSVIDKYHSFMKKGVKFSSVCTIYLKNVFSLSPKSCDSPQNLPPLSQSGIKCEVIKSETPPSTSHDEDLKEVNKRLSVVDDDGNDIYERYFDLVSQRIDAEAKNKKLIALMEDAISKLHEAELHTDQLNATLSSLAKELKIKTKLIDELEFKLKSESEKRVSSINQQLIVKDQCISKLKSENFKLTESVKKKNDYIKILQLKAKESNSNETKEREKEKEKEKLTKPRGRRKKIEVKTPKVVESKEKFRKDLEMKVNNLFGESNSAKISELLLESFPDISISDFEVILKILTDSNALLGQNIIHKWNVHGKDITYYGTIKENLKNQKKFYITYCEAPGQEEKGDDYEIVEYNSLIADIILKDLTFTDPCSLF